jgi:alkanesulfonate monooxygenase SsuD/methylene tetrahydromethanopterin reductase-like flavin-dependent oxidoreductase (luciferase family)
MILGLGAGYLKAEYFALGVNFDERNERFDEVLDTLALHWKGEPFSYRGKTFEARNVIARPRPVQDPIPVWIGGNSRLSRRRAATRAQGWMPLVAPPQVSATARTPAITDLDELAQQIGEIKAEARAAGRTDELDFTYSYSNPSLDRPAVDADRHRDAFAHVEEAGVTWTVVSCSRREPTAVTEFLEEFGATYLDDSAT